MNRADRRRLKRATTKASERATSQRPAGLTHAPPTGSITLVGGPMAGWVVRPNAPALSPDWHAGLIEASAAGLVKPGEWAKLSEPEREPYREQARAKHPPGRYMQRDGNRADWLELP